MSDMIQTFRMMLNMQIISDAMDAKLWEHDLYAEGDRPCLRGCMVFCGQTDLQEDTVYFLLADAAYDFPVDRYAYVTARDIHGKAPHICNVCHPMTAVLNEVLMLFQRYHDFEVQLNGIVSGSCSLTDLCNLCSRFFRNPVYVHDELFAVLATSHRVDGMLKLEYNEKTGRAHIPLFLIEEFKFDPDYQETLTYRHATIWGTDEYPFHMRSLYVNLWDGARYRGRILINELESPLTLGVYQMLEFVAEYVLMILRKNDQSQNHRYRNFQDTFIELLNGADVDAHDLNTILSIMDWKANDMYLCLKLQSQDPNISIRSDSALRSILAAFLSSHFSFYHETQLCVVINLTKAGQNRRSIRQQLAPHIRDSYMYGGLSNPVFHIRQLVNGFFQADIALKATFRERGSRWLTPFETCALEYIAERAQDTIPYNLLISPYVLHMRDYDKTNGTQYYQTLRAYLYCERSIPKTAEALIIHRTTLTYRLGKLFELWSINLDDVATRTYLLLSFHILEQHQPA